MATPRAQGPAVASPRDLRLSRAERFRERGMAGLLLACAAVSVFVTIAVIFTLSAETFAFFRDPAVTVWDFFTDPQWTPLFADKHFGIAPLLVGTLMVTVIAMLVGVPLGLGSAIYLAEFATPALRRGATAVLEVLAGIPTVVLGYFALLFVTPFLQQFVPGLKLFNALSAGLVMGFMILPTIASISSDAMQAVPSSLREAGYGLGATRFEVVLKIIVPAALSGIVASIILGLSRAVGETMIVTLAAGQRPFLTLDPRETIATMTSFIVQAATGDQPAGSLAARSLYAVGATLFVMTLGLNVLSQRIVRRFREVYE